MKKYHSISFYRKNFSNTRQWLLDWLTAARDKDAMILAVSIWHIWDTRNSVRNEANLPHPKHVAERIMAYIEMILQHLFKTKSSKRCESISLLPKWNPPPKNVVMVNGDAALFPESIRMGAGVVMRNHTGIFLAAHCRYFGKCFSP